MASPASYSAGPSITWRAYEGSKPRWDVKKHPAKAPGRESTEGRRRIDCARCGHHITYAESGTERSGLHEHSQVNPHGYIWRFRCFERAPGCVPTSRPSAEFTWFAGYRWQIASCGDCDLHLGWLFTSDADRFWGLIVDRVVERDADD